MSTRSNSVVGRCDNENIKCIYGESYEILNDDDWDVRSLISTVCKLIINANDIF